MSSNPLTSTLILLIAATLTVLIAAYAMSTCDRGIFPFRKSIAMMSFSLTIFMHFCYFRQLFALVRHRFRYMTHAQTLCKWPELAEIADFSCFVLLMILAINCVVIQLQI